jgi:hypothetical protein
MARVKVCPVCEFKNKPAELFCEGDGCGVPLVDVPITDDDNGLQQTAAGSPAARLQPLRTLREESWPAARAVLEFPWGSVKVMERLNVGRDPDFSPIADRLADNEYVSGRHAEVFLEGGWLYVQHVGATNPTYVNGAPIKCNKPAQLTDGDEVSFSRYMTAIVRLG